MKVLQRLSRFTSYLPHTKDFSEIVYKEVDCVGVFQLEHYVAEMASGPKCHTSGTKLYSQCAENIAFQ